MKKKVCFALLLLLSVSVQGCAGRPEETETQTQSVTQMQMELEMETLQGAETESETETRQRAEGRGEKRKTYTVIGSLVDIDMEQITVLSDNGNEIILPIKDAELDFSNGFRVGNLVAVNYTGKLLETDNRKADISVLRAADSSDVEELKLSVPEKETGSGMTGEEETEDTENGWASEETDAGETDTEETDTEGESETAAREAQTVQGEIQKMDRNSMTILTEKNEELTFGIMNVRMYFSKGMAKGTKVVVSYEGEITGDSQGVLSVVDADSL